MLTALVALCSAMGMKALFLEQTGSSVLMPCWNRSRCPHRWLANQSSFLYRWMRWPNVDAHGEKIIYSPSSLSEHVSVHVRWIHIFTSTVFQACRGSKLDDGVDAPDGDDVDGKPQRIPRQADCLYAYSTTPGQSLIISAQLWSRIYFGLSGS